MAKAILIVGMHRSGTSALTGLLQLAGIDLGTNLLPPAEDNPKGFFEHDAVWRVHHQLLRALGSDWDDARTLPDGWIDSEPARQAHQEIRSILSRDFTAVPLWAVKDPRLSRVFSIWPSILDEINVSAHAVLAIRHPLEVAQSIARRDKLQLPHALGMWLRYTLDAELATRSVSRIVSNYVDVLGDWRTTVALVDQAFELDLPPVSTDTAKEIEAFLDVGLRHQRADAKWPSIVVGQPIERWCTDLFEAVGDLPSPSAFDRIDRIRAEVGESEKRMQFLVSQAQDDISERHRLGDAVSWLEEETRRHLSLIDQFKYDIRHREADLIVANEESVRLSLDLDAARSERDLIDNERQSLKRECARLVRDINQLTADWTGAQSRIEAIYKSRSWRITKPVRATSRFLQRFLPGDRHDSAPQALSPADVLVIVQVDNVANGHNEEQTTPSPTPTLTLDQKLMSTAAPATISSPAYQRPDPARQKAPDGLRILLVTPDLHGPIRNGGIGTAFSALARWLAGEGHSVTILYTLGDYSEAEPLSHWQQIYADLGATLIGLPSELSDGGLVAIDGPHFGQIAWRVHDWMQSRQKEFDLAIFPEWSGVAFHVLRAKQQRMHYLDLQIMVNTHSPESWSLEGNLALPENPDFLERDFMERESVAMADWVVSPSHYMLDWMRKHRWNLPNSARVIPNLTDHHSSDAHVAAEDRPVSDIVFFGRLEIRKGLGLFCDAIARLAEADRNRIGRIIFLGKPVVRRGFNSVDYITERTSGWTIDVEVWPDFNRDQALAALREPGRLAVIASLCENSPYTVVECLQHGIAFIATNVGGIPELIDPSDHARILFDPNPAMLGSRLVDALTKESPLPRPACSSDRVEELWSGWLREVRTERSARPAVQAVPPARPKVSVCLVHFERPALLRQSLKSLRAQTYKNFEVILVDDGSHSLEARAMIDGLEAEFELRDWKIIRQPNQYLGAARNRAAAEATGDYLLFMDDDNIALPGEIETFVKVSQTTDADILTSACYLFDTAEPPARPTRLWVPLGNAPSVAVFRNVFGDANAFWKRTSFEKLKGFTTDYGVGHEDWEIFTEAVLNGLILEVVQEPLFLYRIHPNSMIRSGNRWANHARSVRAFSRHDPHGLGMACAYSVGLNVMRDETHG